MEISTKSARCCKKGKAPKVKELVNQAIGKRRRRKGHP